VSNFAFTIHFVQANATTPSVPAAVAKFVALPLRIPWLIAKKLLPSKEQTSATRIRTVLQNVSGVIRPSTLTLVLSPPGHSKSAFLKAITMQLPGQKKSHTLHKTSGPPTLLPNKPGVCGNISYSGATVSDPRGCHLGQLVQYVSQLDEHLPHLTVRETLSFVYQNAVVDPATCGHPELAADHARGVDNIIEFLHLENCQNTIIGNDLMRGVSGGEKKRVTVAEGLATNARLLALDEISTGLDSAVTYKIVKSLRDKAKGNGMAAVISLLQATPEVYGLFDEVVLLREGCVVYHGPTGLLPGYLKSLGYVPPANSDAGAMVTHSNPAHHHVERDMADWLVEFLTDPIAVLQKRPSTDAVPENCPTSTDQLAASWNASEIHRQQMSAPPSAEPLALTTDFAKAQYGHAYAHAFAAHLYYLLIRQFVLMRRNPLYLRARIGSALIMGFILGGLYYQRSIDEGMTYYGTFLNACMNMGFANLAEMATSVEQKYIAYKHISHGNYPTTAFVLAGAVAHIPVSILVCFIYLGILYGMVGLSSGADHFFFFMLICFLVDIFFRNMMALFSYAGRSLQAAQSAPLPVISLLILFAGTHGAVCIVPVSTLISSHHYACASAGFLVAPAKMGWLTFMYYVDIMGYAIRSLAMNEFYSSRYDVHPGNSPHSLGYLYLDAFGIPTDPAWKWGGVAFEAGACIVIIIASYFAFSTIRFDRNIGSRRDAKLAAPPDSAVVDMTSPKVSVTTPTSPVRGAWDSAEEHATGSAPAPTTSASGMPFERMSVVFKDMKYTVQLPKRAGGGSRILLRGINGYAKPGRMTALMGASGAGKTTLLDVLAGRKNQGVMEGEILLNGFPKEEKTFNRVTAYVEQSDVHLPLTTVREAVEFSAALRLPVSVSEKDRAAFVEEVLALLELTSLQHRLVGIAGAANSLAPGE
jgi:ABC-type multidrug transport system ATPase subunit